MLIGLGKHEGARTYHQAFIHYSFDRIIRSVAQTVIEKCKILFGLAILENAAHEPALIEALEPSRFLERERELLVMARKWLTRLPFQRVDLLIVDQMGKNISGTGMDSNVIGRKYYVHYAAPDEHPKVTRIYVRDLTPETKGNATGLGFAEYAHARLIGKIDPEITRINTMTGNRPYLAAIPIGFQTDREAFQETLQTIGYVRPEEAKVVRIRNTIDLGEVMVSEAYLKEIQGREELTVLGTAGEMAFDSAGDLLPF
jgi:hypothetical protein